MNRIGGSSNFGRPKPRTRIGGPEEEESEGLSLDDEEEQPLDAKAEAANVLFRALGVPPESRSRAQKALEAFIYACEE